WGLKWSFVILSPTSFRIFSYLSGGLVVPVPIDRNAKKIPATAINITIGSLFISDRYFIAFNISSKITQKRCFSYTYKLLTMVFDEWENGSFHLYFNKIEANRFSFFD